jgi:glucose-6-phosphate-specific signal transduction histidine kinase
VRERGLIPALRTLARPGGDTSRREGNRHRAAASCHRGRVYVTAEATANAVKHARAHQVEITLARTPQALQLTISDDGVGGAAISGGTGLQGLHDRADAVGGHITLISLAGRPTVLTAHLPILGALTEG